MTSSTISKAARALLLATSAFAADKQNKASIALDGPATVSGHRLPPGEYKLTWDGTGSNVDLTFSSRGKLVATVPAHLIELNQPGLHNAIESITNNDGSQSLTQIDFEGKKYALALGSGPSAESQSQGSSQ
jgi:hypothetical protein